MPGQQGALGPRNRQGEVEQTRNATRLAAAPDDPLPVCLRLIDHSAHLSEVRRRASRMTKITPPRKKSLGRAPAPIPLV
jgi:hypothetical protein